jgi:TetR/AcrR family transcriptional regulator
VRDSERTRKRILDAAAREFSEHGFDGARLSRIARRADTSKQLVHHHFGTKEKLFLTVHALKFRPSARDAETLPENAAEVFADRFGQTVKDTAYVRFLTWEAASARNGTLPGKNERQQRIARYGAALRAMQTEGHLPHTLDHRLLHLAIVALSTYPMAFGHMTRLITGRSNKDPVFQRQWREFLHNLGVNLVSASEQDRTSA